MGWQPGQDDDQGASLGRGREPGAPIPADPIAARDPRLPGFGKDGEWDTCLPSAALAVVLEDVSGPEWRCSGANRDELLGLLRQAQALESRAAAAKLGILRSLIRHDDTPLPGGGYHGDLPEGWTKSLAHEVALDLSMPVVSADKLMWVAWDLAARLPGIGGLLADGGLTYAKAKVVSETFLLLSDENAARAERLILERLPGKTFGQVKRLAEQAALIVDPESAARRREHAERENGRVELFREDSGAAALAGRDLPTDQTLAAHAHICARAQEYQDSGVFPDGTRMDQFRVAAYLDLLNGKSAATRIASGQLDTVTRPADTSATPGSADPGGPEDEGGPDQGPSADGPGNGPDGGSPSDASGAGAPGRGGPGDQKSGGHCDNQGPADGPAGPPVARPPRLVDLVLPLATLLGLAERPGESHALGPLDPDLCRQLAVAAIGSPWTRLCVTVTDHDGIAIGHGCAKLTRNAKPDPSGGADRGVYLHPYPHQGTVLPAQVNLTITAGRLAELTSTGPPGTAYASWSFTPAGDSDPPGGLGTWVLTLPDGRTLTVALEPVPTFDCDHRHESHAYQPSARLRHLVQVRDYTCTFPTCRRHAKDSDFEHAIPYEKGGKTCACNAGARSRACHQIKQAPGWAVTQPRPGWHQWRTPSGRTYTRKPKRYPT